MTRLARTSQEIQLAAGLRPCPTCGAHNRALSVRGSGTNWAAYGPCASCGTELVFPFQAEVNPLLAPAPHEELGEGPSQILSADDLRGEIARLRGDIREAPEQLEPAAWHVAFDALRAAVIAANELLKLAPAPDVAADRDRWRTLKARYKADGDRVYDLEHPVPPKGRLDADALRAHAQWLRNGKDGAGRLELEHLDLTGTVVGAQNISGARLVGVKLVRAALRHATLDDARLTDVDATDANLESASLRGTWIERGSYVRARFTFADLDDAIIDGADLTGAMFHNAFWKAGKVTGAKLGGVTFGNGRIEGTAFLDCDLRGASFAAPGKLPEPTTRGARFEGCDLRDTDWAGRDLSQVTFVRCKLAGAHGAPRAADRLVVENCDVDGPALRAQLGG